jgi:hypothetical protein
MMLSQAKIIYSESQYGAMVNYKTEKLGGGGEKGTVPGSQGIPHGLGWNQTQVCMVTGRKNETYSPRYLLCFCRYKGRLSLCIIKHFVKKMCVCIYIYIYI